MNDFYNPYNYLTQPTNQFLNGNVVKVNGINGANAYQMRPNQMSALFDENEDIFYIKTTDGAGFPSIRTFEFKEVTKGDSQFVTKEEYNRDMSELKGMIENGFKSIRENAE